MIYEYINDETEEVVEADFPMSGDIPKSITREGKKYRRVWALGHGTLLIPDSFKDDDPFKNKYGESPSGRKHYY